MFTGIITDVGRIEEVRYEGAAPKKLLGGEDPEARLQPTTRRVKIACGYEMDSVALGASICCSGACLTVTEKGDDWFAVDITPETQRRTAAGMWDEGNRLNLERALRVGDELGGHIVTGHVDGLGVVTWGTIENGALRFIIKASDALRPYISEKGSIAINGISLTVNEVEDKDDGVYFGVTIIPHTRDCTAMFDRGETVNVEIDILARYIGRMLELRSAMADYPLDIRRT